MGITPTFSLEQDDNNVYLHIHVPNIRVINAAQIQIQGNRVSFYCTPYLLELFLPHGVLDEEGNCDECLNLRNDTENDRPVLIQEIVSQEEPEADDSNNLGSTRSSSRCAKASYDPIEQRGMLHLTLPKENPGQNFADLDLITKLLIDQTREKRFLELTKRRPSPMGLISEVLDDNQQQQEKAVAGGQTEIPAEDKQLNLEKEALPSLFAIHSSPGTPSCGYGFLRSHANIFVNLPINVLSSKDSVLEMPIHPDEMSEITISERRQMRLDMEEAKFDLDHYLGDLELDEDMVFQEATQITPFWHTETPHDNVDDLAQQFSFLSTSEHDKTNFSPQEQQVMVNLALNSRRTGHISAKAQDNYMLFLGMLDLLFAFVYDHRLTGGDPTCESAWTISIISPALSWLEDYDEMVTPIQVLCYGIRRSLVYPYIRNLDFVLEYVIQDVKHIVCQGGRRMVLKCLIQLRTILGHTTSDTYHYLLNTVWLDDYCIWIQNLSDEVFQGYAKTLNRELEEVDWQTVEWIGFNLIEHD